MKTAIFVSSIVALLAFSEAHGQPEGETVSGFSVRRDQYYRACI